MRLRRRDTVQRALPRAAAAALALSMLGFQATATEIYRWKDEQGNTVFSERRPPKVNDAAIVELKTGKASGDAAERLEKARAQFAPPKPEKTPAKAELTPEQQARRASACNQARDALAILQENNRPRYQADDGQLIVMDDALKAARIADAEQKIGEYCDD